MDYKKTLKELGHAEDQAYLRLMEFFAENSSRRWNSNEVSLMKFYRYRKARRDKIPFATETLSRKMRQLAEWGLLERGHDTQGHTWYSYTGPRSPKIAPRAAVEGKVEIRDGRPVFVLV